MISRRSFLGTAAGLSLGIGNDGPGNGPSCSSRSDQDQYEQTLAETDLLELVGVPRNWDAVRQGFLPLSPDRVVIVKPNESRWHNDPGHQWGCSYADRVVRDRIADRIAKEEGHWTPAKLTPEKLSLIVRMTRHVVDYYGVPSCLETWAYRITIRERLLTSGGMPCYAGILDWWQDPGVLTRNAHVDWWMFLFPKGLPCWESLDPNPVHILAWPVFARASNQVIRHRLDVVSLMELTCRRLWKNSKAIAVSQADRVRACRVVNQSAAACLHVPPFVRTGSCEGTA